MLNEMVFKPGHHTPPHFFMADWFYMLTGSIYKQQPLMQSDRRKKEWIEAFFAASELYHWVIIAWVLMENHYHAILKSPQNNSDNLPKYVGSYHKFTAHLWNKNDDCAGRKVWWNYWDTCIRSQNDYLTRLRYIFWNPVKHGSVTAPAEYPYSNYVNFLEEEWFDIGETPIEVENVPEF